MPLRKPFAIILLALSISAAHAQTVAYVTNNGTFSVPGFPGNTVSVIDTSTNTVTATIAVGNAPTGVVFSPDGTRAYVTNLNDCTISVIDTTRNTVASTISLPRLCFPTFPAITPDGKTLYVPDEFSGNLLVVSAASGSVIATIPANPTDHGASAVAVTPDGTRAYALSQLTVSVIDTATNTIVQTIPVRSATEAFPFPDIAIMPGSGNIYVGGQLVPDVQVISPTTNTVIATIPFTGLGDPFGVVITPDGGRAYVSNFFFNTVSIIDTATNTLEPFTISVGSPVGLGVTPDGAFLYVANATSNTVSVIATATNTVSATVTVGNGPLGITIANLSTPFSQFGIRGLSINSGGFTEAGDLTLSPNSTGIDLAQQPVTLTVDSFSLTIPADSFTEVGRKVHFVFNGTISGLSVSMTLMANQGSSTQFKYSVTVSGVDLTGQPNPATVGLKIGNNTGTTTVAF